MTMVRCVLLIVIAVLSGCTKNEFKIEFSFPKETIGNFQVTYYAWDSKHGFWVETTAVLQEGRAVVDGMTRRPTLLYIKDISSGMLPLALYVERGETLTISGDSPDPYTWTVKGDKISEQWAAWRAENASMLRQGGESAAKAVEKFVKGHKDSRLSAMLLLTEFDRRENPEIFLSLWNSISKDVRDPQLAEMAGVPDLSGSALETGPDGNLRFAESPKLKTLVLRTLTHGIDTLDISKAKASILYFSESSSSSRREAIDTLRSVSKAYPDSAGRIIADIYAEPDSMMWTRSIRHDSLSKAVRAWLPKNLADPLATEAGVTRLPWFIVLTKGGARVYSGQDLKEAARAFRKSMK